MTEYTILLFRSGRVFVVTGDYDIPEIINPPFLVEKVIANSEIAALGKALLKYVDKANQPVQHICVCNAPCCQLQPL